MQSPTYSFDPHDWSTITPRLDALLNAPVSDHNFMHWLAQWNQLDIDIWDAYTQLKHPAYVDTRNQDAENVYQAYVKELYSTYIRYTNRLIAKALALRPDAPGPSYGQLWRRWHNQSALLSPASQPIQSEISLLENRYRTIMWAYDGTPEDPLAYWMARRDELNELMMQLLTLRRKLARINGQPTYLAFRWRELNRLDYTIADCQAFHRAVEEMVPAIARFRQGNALAPSFPPIEDVQRLTDGVEDVLHQVDPAFSRIFHALRNGYLDLGHRPHKAASNESWFFPGAGLPYIHVASGNAASVFHESGHAIHDYLSFQAHGSLWNFSGPEVFQEFAATGVEILTWPHYDHAPRGEQVSGDKQAQGPLFTAAESRAARQNGLNVYVNRSLVGCVLQDAFEHWLYGEAPEEVTPADLDAKWLELKARFEPWDIDYKTEDEKRTGWQRNTFSLFRWPLYMITYSMATVGACQLARLAETDPAATIENFTHALTLGNTQSLPALFNTCGLTFPFTTEAVQDAVQFLFEQAAELSDASSHM